MSDLPPPTNPERKFCSCGAEPRKYMLETGIKLLADKVRSMGYANLNQESNGELVGRAIWDLERQIKDISKHAAEQNDEIVQTLGKALGFPWFKDDQENFPGATEADGVCVGVHTAETLADHAAARIKALETEVQAYRDAAQYDALMSGPAFKGWNRSQLDRARRLSEQRISQE